MKRETMDSDRRRARDMRVVLAGLLGLSMLANLVLSHGLANRERMTVLVPAVSGPAWKVGESWAGRRYLEDAARTAAVTLLTLTPENAAPCARGGGADEPRLGPGAIGAWVSAEAERMARRDLATAFYPQRIDIEPEALAAVVSGELVTWIGREEASRARKRYRLVFRIDGGRIGLLRFEEREE